MSARHILRLLGCYATAGTVTLATANVAAMQFHGQAAAAAWLLTAAPMALGTTMAADRLTFGRQTGGAS